MLKRKQLVSAWQVIWLSVNRNSLLILLNTFKNLIKEKKWTISTIVCRDAIFMFSKRLYDLNLSYSFILNKVCNLIIKNELELCANLFQNYCYISHGLYKKSIVFFLKWEQNWKRQSFLEIFPLLRLAEVAGHSGRIHSLEREHPS